MTNQNGDVIGTEPYITINGGTPPKKRICYFMKHDHTWGNTMLLRNLLLGLGNKDTSIRCPVNLRTQATVIQPEVGELRNKSCD
jgi:hypothetical protein